jgi:DNA-binding transcriptional regulator YiaG
MTPDEFLDTRLSLSLTQLELAQALGVTERTVRNYETGFTPISSPIVKLMEFLIKKKEVA